MTSRSTSGQPNASTATSTASLRPRNRRLLSTELHGNDFKQILASSDRERGISPIPTARLSRTGSSAITAASSSYNATAAQGNNKSKGLWDGGWAGNWSSLQGLANSLLGGGVEDGIMDQQPAKHGRRTIHDSKKQAPSTWGPSGSLPIPRRDRIATGSLEERDRAVKARKTASVLESHERVNGGLDVRGQHKRRVSTDEAISNEPDDYTMVYVHPVTPKDTVTGVVLKYNCQPAAFRKANRLWPNDPIQFRKIVLLPVDACSIRSRPCEAPTDGSGVDLLAPTPNAEEPPATNNHSLVNEAWQTHRAGATESSPFDPLPHQVLAEESEESEPWTHVRWVMIDSSPNAKPVSLARIRVKDLGYFPPRRRKSQNTMSTASSPRTSLDHPLSQVHSAAPGSPSGSIRRSSNLSTRPVISSYFPDVTSEPQSTSRDSYRSYSAATTPRPGAGGRRESSSQPESQLAMWMRGPGGVGTLGKNVRKPGPAQDGLNSWAHKNLPGVSIDYLPSCSIAGGETVNWSIDRIDEESRTLAAGLGSIGEETRPCSRERAQGKALENLASGIEGWVRRLAVRPSSIPKTGASHVGEGDLIELLDGSDDGHGFEPTAEALANFQDSSITGGSGRDDLLGTLRGRGASKGGKSE